MPFLMNPTLKLREYQKEGVNWLVSMCSRKLNGILADEMVRSGGSFVAWGSFRCMGVRCMGVRCMGVFWRACEVCKNSILSTIMHTRKTGWDQIEN